MKATHCSKRLARWFARVIAPWLALVPLSAAAANFYVATNGDDGAAGTLAAPFASITKAESVANSGDTIYVRGGTYSSFTIAGTDSNYNYVHQLSKSGITYSAYPGETPIFDFSSVPTNLRVCGFHVTGGNVTIIGFVVTGTKVGTQKQSENFRIDGSASSCDFYNCVCHDTEANGFYFTNHAAGSCTNCDAYNNIGTNSDAIGNTDGFGAHGRGVVFRYCRSWHNSDDGYDCIASEGANTFDHCWAYNMTAGGDSNGFKSGGWGTSTVPATVPVHTVTYCLAANVAAHGFYANHQPGQAATWTHNTAYNNSAGNFDMLERVSPTDATDIPGYREVLHNNIAFTGIITRDDNDPPENETNNSWTIATPPTAADFQSVDASQMTAPRNPDGSLPTITFMHLTSGSPLAGLGCFDPAPVAPSGLTAAWVNGSRVDLSWTASPDGTRYTVKRATTSGGPYIYVASNVTGTGFSDTTVSAATTTYYYVVSASNDTAYDPSADSAEAAAIQGPSSAVTAISPDTGSSSTDAITNATTLTLSGTTSAAFSTISIARGDAGVIGSTTADAAGHWSFDYTGVSLAAGTYTFTATATLSGVIGVESPALTVVVDTTAPAAPAFFVSGSGPVTLEGTAEADSTVAITRAGAGVIGTSVADAGGHWTFTDPTVLPPGVYSFTANATDVAGNAGADSAAVTIDTTVAAPVFAGIVSDTGVSNSDQVTNDATLVLNGSAEPGATIVIRRVDAGVIGTVVADGSGQWSFDYTGTTLAAGTYRFTASANTGGNPSPQSAVFTVTIATSAPTVSSIVRQNPTGAILAPSVGSVVYRATFSDAVYGVDASDFVLTTTGTATGMIAGVSASSGTTIDVTVNALGGEGDLRLDLRASGTGITDLAGNPVGGFTGGQSYSRITSGSGTWTQAASGGLWSDKGNWLNSIIADGAANTADFSTLNLTANNTVHLDSARTLNHITFGDTTTSSAASWIVDNGGNGANTLTLSGSGPGITVNPLGPGATATISATLTGTAGLAKSGPGALVLAGTDAFPGPLALSAGPLQIPAGGSLAVSTVTLTGASTLGITGGAFSTSGTVSMTSANLALSGGTVTLGGALSLNSNKDGNIVVSGGTFTAPDVNISRSSDSTVNFAFGFIISGGTATLGQLEVGSLNSNGFTSVEGGTLVVNGPVVVGNQATSGRGGGIRTTAGSLTINDTTLGLVLGKKNGSNANNVTTATFSGGTSTIGRLTLGFDATVTGGSGNVTVSGGALYVGSGGIVKNGASTMTTNVIVSSGTLGAADNWSTTHPVTITGTATLKAADANGAPFDITLGGVVSGAGSFTKTGGGALTLAATNTGTGSITVSAGTLNVTGTLAAGGNVTLNAGGTLAGTGTVNKPILLNAGGTLAPAGAATGTLAGASLTWNGGGTWAADLGSTSDQLALTGALTRGTAGTFTFAFTPGSGFAAGNVYTLASFGSTNFAAADFSSTGLPDGFAGAFAITGGTLQFTVIGTPEITSAGSAAGVFGAPFSYTIAATNTPATFSGTGLPPGLTVDSSTGVISGTPTAAGSYNAQIAATNPAGTGTAALTIVIAKAPAAVSLGGLTATYDGAAHAVTATTAPAGLAVAVTYDGSPAAPVHGGSYTVAATIVDANYAGGATGTLVIARAAQTITFPNPGTKTYGDAPFALTATASSGLPVSYAIVSGPATISGNVVTLTGAGTVTVRATQAGNGDYLAAPSVDATFTVEAANATVTLQDLTQAYDGTPKAATAVTDPSGLTVTITYDGNATAPTLPGSYAVVATIDDPNYHGTASGTLVITVTALVRHAPTINGDVDGSVQVLLGESTTFNGGAGVTGDLLVPGTPTVRLNGQPAFAGVQDSTAAVAPSNYTVTLNGNALLRYLVRRVDPLPMPTVSAPPAATGTRDVVLNNAGQSVGNFATVRDLTLNGNVGQVAVPAGTYRNITVNGSSRLTLGIAGATEPAVYNLQNLTLNGSARIDVVGPVTLTLANGVTINGNIGTTDHPEWLTIRIAAGGLTLNGNVTVAGSVVAPAGTVIINGSSTLNGNVTADRLTINGQGLLAEPQP